MTTLLLTWAVCPVCRSVRTPHELTRDWRGLICADRVACLRAQDRNLAPQDHIAPARFRERWEEAESA